MAVVDGVHAGKRWEKVVLAYTEGPMQYPAVVGDMGLAAAIGSVVAACAPYR